MPVFRMPGIFLSDPLRERLPDGNTLFSLSIRNNFNCRGEEKRLIDCGIDHRVITASQCSMIGAGVECPITGVCYSYSKP